MSPRFSAFLAVFLAGIGVGAGARAADAVADAPAMSASQGAPGDSPSVGGDWYQQLLSLSAGSFVPQSAVITNGSYSFDYGTGPQSASSSFLVEGGWAIRLFDALPGAFYLSENIAYTRFSGTVSSINNGGVTDTSLSANLIGLDSRLNFSIERFPVRWIIPFGEAGYQYTFYSQGGSSDLDSVQGATGNFVAGAGLRLWINRHSSIDSDLRGVYSALPVFVILKWNRILPNGGALDLADSGFMGGLSIGL